MSSILNYVSVGILCYQNKTTIDFKNKFVDELLGDNSHYIESVHNDFKDAESSLWNNFFDHNQISNSECQIYSKKLKEYLWMQVQRTLIVCNGVHKFMITLLNINETKKLEIKLINETQQKEAAYNHNSAFLTNMSHEIRTPLNGIIGMLTLLEDTKISSDQESYINMIKECSYNLMTIINDILDYSKLEIGKILLDIKPMSLQQCIESTNDIILSKIYEKSLEYSYIIQQDVDDFILGDSNRIKQILLNLLSNAIKFTDKGTIFLSIKKINFTEYKLLLSQKNLEPSTSNDIFLRFDVTDTGHGIDPNDKNKLFKSFTQIQSKLSPKINQGTGLGLVIAKELVELMDGAVWLEWSTVSIGSQFSFVIKTQSVENTKYISMNENVLLNASVLILDDNLFNRISLSGMVSKWGMKAYVFSNAEEALHFTKITPFDIGLIDICMPKIDGTTFAYKLRQQDEFKNKFFPLIALSSIGDKSESISSVFKGHISKPIKEKQLKAQCITFLSEEHPTSNASNHLDKKIESCFLDFKEENVRILLVEDIFINQKVIVSFLNKIGFNNVVVVDDGQKCLNSVFSNDFDIILLDIRIPIKNGEEVFHDITEYYKIHTTKKKPYIIAVTAYCLRGDKQKYLDMGFDDYIPKPISFSNLSFCMHAFTENLLKE